MHQGQMARSMKSCIAMNQSAASATDHETNATKRAERVATAMTARSHNAAAGIATGIPHVPAQRLVNT